KQDVPYSWDGELAKVLKVFLFGFVVEDLLVAIERKTIPEITSNVVHGDRFVSRMQPVEFGSDWPRRVEVVQRRCGEFENEAHDQDHRQQRYQPQVLHPLAPENGVRAKYKSHRY